MSDSALCRQTASDLAAGIRRREISAVEVMDAHLARIEQVNPVLNAIVTLDAGGARRAAAQADRELAAGVAPGLLHGLPIAVKDLKDTAGMRTTYGSPIYHDHVPQEDAPLVARLRRAGAIVIGKTNTPEFGAGSQTFNPVFGATRNPYDPSRTPGGSSGGAAAAVAAGMLPLADGSDLGASVRNPASFCNVVGLRPSPGRIPDSGLRSPWDPLGVLGPIARTVADATLLLRALSGPDPRAPLSLQEQWDSLRSTWRRIPRGSGSPGVATSAIYPWRLR
jgi:amidase